MAPAKRKALAATLRRYRRELQGAGIPLFALYLFGSYAKGTPRRDSDIDVAVVSPRFGKNFVRESVLVNRIADAIDDRIEAHPLHPNDLRDQWSTFAREIQEHGQRIN